MPSQYIKKNMTAELSWSWSRRRCRASACHGRTGLTEGLEGVARAIVKGRNQLRVKAEWQFALAQTLERWNRHREKV